MKSKLKQQSLTISSQLFYRLNLLAITGIVVAHHLLSLEAVVPILEQWEFESPNRGKYKGQVRAWNSLSSNGYGKECLERDNNIQEVYIE